MVHLSARLRKLPVAQRYVKVQLLKNKSQTVVRRDDHQKKIGLVEHAVFLEQYTFTQMNL